MSEPAISHGDRVFPVSNIIAGIVCLAGCIAFLMMALALPAGHSTGDTGPGALPVLVGIVGSICSLAYLVITMRGAFADEQSDFSRTHRALAAFLIFVISLAGVKWIGLPLSIAAAAGLVTLLFPGERRLLRAGATGIGLWLIAVLLFGKLLGLPMP